MMSEERAIKAVVKPAAPERAGRAPWTYSAVRITAAASIVLVVAAGAWLLVDAGAGAWVVGLLTGYLDILWPFN
ncbi:hypothetical protein [Pseudonocardia sp. TRM90224]|uniref:hypothetical protein n=1 Tax=Pseudonocardia sp. TRM90224 TaxID=2812678 RepID=UPI001E2D34B5|nr:hypothetical protein [Pseudonocardia sp. TRM90224]